MWSKNIEERFAPVVSAIQRLSEQDTHMIVGIDGRCGSGKTTLGAYLAERLGANVFHMDDFFLRPEQRTTERLQQPGGNVDYERFEAEVLTPLKRRETVLYRRYDCARQQLAEAVEIPYRSLTIVEGSYSLHPYFKEPYQLKVFLTIDAEQQIEVIRARSGEEKLQRFIHEWIPKEEAYFEEFAVSEGCMII